MDDCTESLPGSDKLRPNGLGRLEETKRIRRVIELIQLIAAQPRHWLRRDLAARFGVSERQIDKDLELVRHGLIPGLIHDRDGYFFERLPAVPVLPLSFGEALALTLTAQVGRATPGVDPGHLASAISRLEALFPIPIQDYLRRSALANSPDPASGRRAEILRSLGEAIERRRKVLIGYRSATRGGAFTERTVRPYVIYHYGRSWYLVAFCELTESVKFFKLDRIVSLVETLEDYSIPASFNMADYLGGGWGIIRQPEVPPERVELIFRGLAAWWVREEQWHPSQKIEPLSDGAVRFVVEVPLTPELVRWVLGYGRMVNVMAPLELREAVLAEVRGMLEEWT